MLWLCRYQLGEGLEKKESDLAQDVEEQQAALQAKAAEKKTQEPAAPVEQIPDQPSVKVNLVLQLLHCSLYCIQLMCTPTLQHPTSIKLAVDYLSVAVTVLLCCVCACVDVPVHVKLAVHQEYLYQRQLHVFCCAQHGCSRITEAVNFLLAVHTQQCLQYAFLHNSCLCSRSEWA